MITTNSLVIGLLLSPVALVIGWRARSRLARFDARNLRAEIDAWRRLAHDAHRPVGEWARLEHRMLAAENRLAEYEQPAEPVDSDWKPEPRHYEPTPADMGAFPTDVADFDWTFLP